ncbi:MAG: DNA-directed RNA polymerase subunit beta [Promethearchaeota archaeon]|jgi:DNA-directed RNA polymerase beta subunit
MISEDQTWKILENHFNTEGFVRIQIDSYDNFLNTGIPEIIDREPDIVINLEKTKYTVQFSDVYIPQPTINEEDRTISGVYPAEARIKDLTYSSPVYVKITEILEIDGEKPEITVHPRVVIARIPIMLRSDRCYLSTCSPSERIKYGEDPHDQGGYFILKGNERVLVSQIRCSYNTPLVYKQKESDKYSYISEVRSMSESTGHSCLIQAMIGTDNRTLVFSLPFIKETIPMGVIFKAMGFSENELISLIGLSADTVKQYLKLIIRDSYFCEATDEEVESYFDEQSLQDEDCEDDENSNSNLEEWNDKTLRKYKQKATQQKSLVFISNFLLHTLKDNESKIEYARQVIETEMFPHMGILASINEKGFFLGHIVNKLLSTVVGMRVDDDRDNYINKRVESPGVLCYELFRQLFKKYINTIESNLIKKKQHPDAMSNISKLNIITKGLLSCFSTGKWGVQKNNYIRQGVSQVISRLSFGATLSYLRRVAIPTGKDSKNTKLRQINPSQIMYICPCECFDPETEIYLWNGNTKKAKNIILGDVLIDDNGLPTKVKSTCSGVTEMYEVKQNKINRTNYTVTSNHILTLVIKNYKNIRIKRNKFETQWFDKTNYKNKYKTFETKEEGYKYLNTISDDNTLDIKLEDYLKLPDSIKQQLHGFLVNEIKWPRKELVLDPYILGMWLGDGDSAGYGFTTADPELLEHWKAWGVDADVTVKKSSYGEYHYNISSTVNNTQSGLSCNKTEKAPLKKLLDHYNLQNNKHIPLDYINNDKNTRLALLAGLIDTDGNVRNKHEIRICQGPKNTQIIYDAEKLARSLGYVCHINTGTSQWTHTNGEKRYSTYTELTITGTNTYEIPTRLPRKKIHPYVTLKEQFRSDSFRQTSISVTKKGMGPFVGWQLDGNGRFLLKDCTVVHNTPEGGGVGIVLNFSLLTKISNKTPSVLVRSIIEKSDNLINFINIELNEYEDNTKILLNGIPMGFTEDPDAFVDEIKLLRYNQLLPFDVSISYDETDDEIKILSDEGRLIRPLFKVDGTKLVLKQEDGTEWSELIDKGIINYVDNNEINNAVIAFDQNQLSTNHYDYCEIAPAMMLGVMASIIPFPDHSQAPRNCYASSMGKQAIGMFSLSHMIRTDTSVHVLGYPQKPLVSTKPATMMGFDEMPSGINAIVAVACYGGWNQEDSVILNQSAIERGLFHADTYKTHTEEERKQDTNNFEIIGPIKLCDRQRNNNYALLDEHGIVRKGSYVEKGDVIISKMIIIKSKEETQNVDASVVIKKGEQGFIDRIIITNAPSGYKLVKVIVRTSRIPEVGDKFASRVGQKGTVGAVFRQEDLPFTEDGMVPDIIINPHALPSRMTINQLLECVLGKSCVLEGKRGDATPFTSNSLNIAQTLCDTLSEQGYDRTGEEYLTNGMTGELIKTKIFIGPTYYQRLKHMVSDKIHARAQGHKTTLHHQPLEGRNRAGGLRCGEMERDCLASHGGTGMLSDRLDKQSDPYSVPVCKLCGFIATSQTYCKACKSDKIDQVNFPYISKLLTDELRAMLLKMVIKTKD